jgi:hypothetical protein
MINFEEMLCGKKERKKTVSLTPARHVPQRFFIHVLDTTDIHCNVINLA